jgi:hypothetical protein
MRTRRGKAATEYVIITTMMLTCSIAIYFSVLVTGVENLGMTVCGECPKTEGQADNPFDDLARHDDEPADDSASDDGDAENAPENPEHDGTVASSANDAYNRIDNEYWGYIWNSWFSWIYA